MDFLYENAGKVVGETYLRALYGFDVRTSEYITKGHNSDFYRAGSWGVKLYNDKIDLSSLTDYVGIMNRASEALDGRPVGVNQEGAEFDWRVLPYVDFGVGKFEGRDRCFAVSRFIEGINLGRIYRDLDRSARILPKSVVDFWTDQDKRSDFGAVLFRLSKDLNSTLDCSLIKVKEENVTPILSHRKSGIEVVNFTITDLADKRLPFTNREIQIY